MKKRVISWLLCLALCLSMLPMAALAEDVQKPEGPASSMNEPEPEAEEKETPAPKPEEQPEENPTEEPEQKEPEQEPKQEQEESPIEQPEKEPEAENQPELMTVGNLFVPLALDESSLTFTVGEILAEQDYKDIGKSGLIGVQTTVRVVVSNITLEERGAIVKAGGLAITVDGDSDSLEQTPTFGGSGDEYYVYSVFKPTKTSHTVCVTITYNGITVTRTSELTFTKCTHPSRNDSTGKCTECGAALVAELTAGASSSATYYYETLEEALSAAQTEANSGCTVKLLADCSLLSKYELEKGTFTLDLDGHALTQTESPMWVSGTANLTVKNNSSNAKNTGRFSLQSETATLSVTKGSKYALLMNIVSRMNVACFLGPDMGYKNANGAWANFGQLNSGAIYDVTVEQAPFTTSDITISPENAYVNRKVTLSVTLSNLETGTTPTCSYFVSDSSNYQTSYDGIELDANRAFTVEFTPREKQYYIRARITAGEFTVVKTIKKTFNTCEHGYGLVNQNTGYCKGCDSWMAASVSPSSFVDQRTYYETFDLAMNAAWNMLKSQDCWFTMFQDAQVETIEYQYLGDLSGKTLYMDLNGQTLTSRGVAFRVQWDKWKLDITNGTVIGDTSNHNPVQGVIEVDAGGYLNVHGTTKIQNKGAETKGVNAPSIMVHGSSLNSGRGYAYIAGDEKYNFGSLFINGGNVTVNGGTYDHAMVTYGGSLEVNNGKFQGDVTVDDHASLVVGSNLAYFDGKLTFESEGMGRLTNGYYKHIITKEATLGKLSNNTLDVFYIGEDYQPNAKNQSELKADEGTYITIRKHKHDFSNSGTCVCGEKAEAYLWVNGPQQYGYFDDMLALAEEKDGSCVYLLKDVTIIRDTAVKKGNFNIAGGSFKVTCSGSSALVFSGGTVSIGDGTFGRLKVTGDGKLTLNGGKYYAIDVTGSTVYTNYGKLLKDYYAFKTSTSWEAKSDITEASFASDTAKEVKILPLRSVTISADGSTTVPAGASVKFTATVETNSSGATYKWFCDNTEIAGETTSELTVTKSIGSYAYRCEVTRDNYTLSSNTVQLTVQRIALSGAALSATIQTRAYDGSASATVTASSIGNSGLAATTDYTISAEFEDKNAGENKKVTVTVTLTNTNYCFGYYADGTPILEKTFETTGTITQNTDSREPISVDENIYNSAAHTYKFDLDSYLTAIKDDLGTMSYGMPQPQRLQRGIGTPVLEGHTLKLPVSAIRWASETSLGRITIPVKSQNYANVSIEICLKLVERTAVTASATPSKTELTYGEKLDTIALSGTTDPTIQGTFAWQTPDAILDAGTYTELGWKFTPDNYTYAEASGTAAITVEQARLTDPAPVTLTIYNGWAATYEAALPELPALAEGLRFGNDAAYGAPVVSASGYYSSGAELKTVNGKQGVSIPILKNETTEEGQAGTITVRYTSQNYEPVTLAINLVAKNRTVPTFILTADHDTLSGGGKVTLTLERGNLPDGAVVTVSGTDEAGNAVTLTDNGNGTYSASLPNKTQTYTFIAVYDGSQTIAPKTDVATAKVQQRSSGGGEPAKPSFPVKISSSGDGVAKVDKSYASAGDKVTITVTPGRNATVQRITVTDKDGERLKLTENRDGTYSFTMPSGTANVYVRFSGSGLPFADVPSGSWYYDDVAYVYDTGLMTGLTVTAFGPNLSTTRGMIVTILWRMENEPAAKHGCPFADVRRGSYYEQAIAWASENGIVTGFDASTFAPDRTITREQLAAILFRFAAYRGMDAVTLCENLSSFQDQAAISVYAVSALNWAVGEGLMQGTGDKLEPTGSATRAQVAAMLRRFMQRNF